jgi:alpha-galactosidase
MHIRNSRKYSEKTGSSRIKKQLYVSILLIMSLTNAFAQINNGLALTPPMGWNSWNKFNQHPSDLLIRQIADAMVSSGMAGVGYKYINIDDCWQKLGRDSKGHVQPDPSNFPNGVKVLADYLHAKGLKFGVYSDHGTQTCSGREGSYMHETIDANDYAAWGVDYLKYDHCFPQGNDTKGDYERMRDALQKCGRPIVFSICAWSYSNWMRNTGNLWRTTNDISDNWSSMISIYDQNVILAANAKPGGWNDPDMMEIGNGGMTDTEYRTHMSLWCIMAAPLILGNDLRSMSAATKAILTAPEIIAVDQDSLGKQGVKVRDDGNFEVISKILKGTNIRAVALLNRSGSAANIKVSWSEIGLPSLPATVRDLWTQKNLGTATDSYTINVPAHGTAMLKITSSNSLYAAFSADHTSICPGQTVAFTDQSGNGPTSWNWTFQDGIPAASTKQNPNVQYLTAGTYPVTLTVSNASGSNSFTQTAYITVSASGQLSPLTTVVSQSSSYPGEGAEQVFDNDESTFWQNDWGSNTSLPHTLVYNLGSAYDIQGMDFLNRQDNTNGYSKNMEIFTSTDNINWSKSTLVTLTNTASWQTKNFTAPNTKYLKLKIVSTYSGSSVCSVAEIKLKGCPDISTGILTEEKNNLEKFDVFPNPTNSVLNIQLNNSSSSKQPVEIYDVLGRKRMIKNLETGQTVLQFDIAELGEGIYFIKYKEHTEKFIVSHE